MAFPARLLVLLSLYLSSSSSSSVEALAPIPPDAAALLDFKAYVSLDPSGLLSGWNTAAGSHCDWYGVNCDGFSDRITSLNLTGISSSELAGTLPESVGNLTELRVLSLPRNAFSGKLPGGAIGNLRRLEALELQGNNFSGEIPDQVSRLSFLRRLDLADNSFSGAIPEGLIGLSRLQFLDLSHNQLSGKIKVGPLRPCDSLSHLRLSGNLLVDRIPPEIGKCHNLESLLLNGNILEGRIPPEIGQLLKLRVLDVSRNSLTDRIPAELANCRNLSVIVLTNLAGDSGSSVEFNAFIGAIPPEILMLPRLEILWAPRANLDGQLPAYWGGSCKLRVLNLGQNYLKGSVPEQLGLCRNLTFLDLSSNELVGLFPWQIRVGCIGYLNVSRNSMSGSLPRITSTDCIADAVSGDLEITYSEVLVSSVQMSYSFGFVSDEDLVVLHDFSWNSFVGSLPSFLLPSNARVSYILYLNNNVFNGSLPGELFAGCKALQSFLVDLSNNQISGEISPGLLPNCLPLKHLNAAHNQLTGPLPSGFSDLFGLLHLDLSRNNLTGTISEQLGKLRFLELLILGDNGLQEEIPIELGEMVALTVLDLSKNALMGSIPSSLANASSLQVLLLDHNRLSGNIPSSFSKLDRLTTLDVSFNNLSGNIPYLKHTSSCDFFKGNSFLQPCPEKNAPSPAGLTSLMEQQKQGRRNTRMKLYIVTLSVSATVVVSFLLILVVFVIFKRRKIVRFAGTKRKVVVTFTDAPPELNYDNVIKATGNFSIRNLIGMGGFGSTYKAELVPGFLVAVKRLSIGRLQGLKQFDAEIRTLGRIRHKNLVTLIGYHMGEVDTFLIYNYLPGGNLEKFIHDRSGKNARWQVIHKIALDVAQALAYLHGSCVPRIVHRDIKPSNILLDEKLNAYLSDFGLAKLLEVSETHATTDVFGTFGYVAPEYATSRRVSDKADVYSFGVVLLEMMSGKRSLDPSFSEYGDVFNIVTWAKLLIKERRRGELFIPKLWEAGPEENLLEMLKIASSCTVESLAVRPSMKHIVNSLKLLKNY